VAGVWWLAAAAALVGGLVATWRVRMARRTAG